MHEDALRTVLLVKAIEQSDRTGALLPQADRAEATRKTARDDAALRDEAAANALSPRVERFLTIRAERLLDRIELRSPVVSHVLTLAQGASWLSRALCIVAFVLGVSLSALDGSRRINILAFPLLGLILWNLVVYALLIWDKLRPYDPNGGLGSRLAEIYERWIHWRAEALLRRSARFNAPLASGLRRFAEEWSAVAPRLLILRAKRLFHLCAALVAVGLIAGLYVRGIGLRYEAGWESTFLGPGQVCALLKVLYGPASALSGIALPGSDEAVQALRWGAVGGGGEAAQWIHLLALTALLYIILPRLAGAAAASVSHWWAARRVVAPASLIPYVRETLATAGESVRHVVSVTPYAYEPDANSVRGLEHLLSVALGGTITVDMRDPVRYGDEEFYAERQARGAGRVANTSVLLMSLASTPEPENHGAVIAGTRDALLRAAASAPLAVVIDEAPFSARFGTDGAYQARLEERRRLWRDFTAGYGLRVCPIDLSRLVAADSVSPQEREALRAALWTARERAGVS